MMVIQKLTLKHPKCYGLSLTSSVDFSKINGASASVNEKFKVSTKSSRCQRKVQGVNVNEKVNEKQKFNVNEKFKVSTSTKKSTKKKSSTSTKSSRCQLAPSRFFTESIAGRNAARGPQVGHPRPRASVYNRYRTKMTNGEKIKRQ